MEKSGEIESAVLKADLEAFCKPYSVQVYLYADGHTELGYAEEGFEEETRSGEAIEAFSTKAGKDNICYCYSDDELAEELQEKGAEIPESCESVIDYADEEYPEIMEEIRKQLYEDTVSKKEVIEEFWEKFYEFLED